MLLVPPAPARREDGVDLESLSEAFRSAWVLWLMILFVGIVFWAFRPKRRRRLDDDGETPFGDQNDRD